VLHPSPSPPDEDFLLSFSPLYVCVGCEYAWVCVYVCMCECVCVCECVLVVRSCAWSLKLETWYELRDICTMIRIVWTELSPTLIVYGPTDLVYNNFFCIFLVIPEFTILLWWTWLITQMPKQKRESERERKKRTPVTKKKSSGGTRSSQFREKCVEYHTSCVTCHMIP
jgi:hypothetical protein